MASLMFTEEIKQELLRHFFNYIEETANPKIAEFCYHQDIDSRNLYRFSEKEGFQIEDDRLDRFTWSRAIKKCAEKSEFFLLNMLDDSQVKNPAGAIFRLKAQHGYRDSEPAPAASVVNVNVTDLAKKEDDELESLISGKIAPKPAAKRPKSAHN